MHVGSQGRKHCSGMLHLARGWRSANLEHSARAALWWRVTRACARGRAARSSACAPAPRLRCTGSRPCTSPSSTVMGTLRGPPVMAATSCSASGSCRDVALLVGVAAFVEIAARRVAVAAVGSRVECHGHLTPFVRGRWPRGCDRQVSPSAAASMVHHLAVAAGRACPDAGRPGRGPRPRIGGTRLLLVSRSSAARPRSRGRP